MFERQPLDENLALFNIPGHFELSLPLSLPLSVAVAASVLCDRGARLTLYASTKPNTFFLRYVKRGV